VRKAAIAGTRSAVRVLSSRRFESLCGNAPTAYLPQQRCRVSRIDHPTLNHYGRSHSFHSRSRSTLDRSLAGHLERIGKLISVRREPPRRQTFPKLTSNEEQEARREFGRREGGENGIADDDHMANTDHPERRPVAPKPKDPVELLMTHCCFRVPPDPSPSASQLSLVPAFLRYPSAPISPDAYDRSIAKISRGPSTPTSGLRSGYPVFAAFLPSKFLPGFLVSCLRFRLKQ
jgi:hypothetical protein